MTIVDCLMREHDIFPAASFADLAEAALALIEQHRHAEMICGPITTGGAGSLQANMHRMAAVILRYRRMQKPVWSQLAFETELWRLQALWRAANPDAADYSPIMEEFYLPIFRSGRLRRARMFHDWRTSKGTTRERELFAELGIPIMEIPEWFIDRALLEAADREALPSAAA